MVATVVWIGGILYQSIFLLPILRSLDDIQVTGKLLERLRNRFQPIAWLSLAILIGTGLVQMSANPNYDGFLAIENTWAQAILLKHVAIALMILIAAYQSLILFPKLTREWIVRSRGQDPSPSKSNQGLGPHILNLNVLLSIIVLILTSIARAA